MRPVNDRDRKRNMLLFVLAVMVTAGIGFLLFTSSKQLAGINIGSKGFVHTVGVTQQDNMLVQYDEELHSGLNYLQQLDGQYAALLASKAPGKSYDSLNTIILQQEEDFRKRIDEFYKIGSNKRSDTLFSKMIASFQSALQQRKSVGYLRNAAALGQSNLTPDKNALLALQNDLMTKNSRVTTLENSLRALEKKEAESQPQLVSNQNAKFADSVKFVAAINVLELKAASLTTANNNLRQDVDRLQKQNESTKNNINEETVLKEKANILQQRLDAVNTELQLARVDCNLSRVDARQIISTTKQRKMLLDEASSILTDLSNSGNAEVKRKVQDKIEQVNKLTANSKD